MHYDNNENFFDVLEKEIIVNKTAVIDDKEWLFVSITQEKYGNFLYAVNDRDFYEGRLNSIGTNREELIGRISNSHHIHFSSILIQDNEVLIGGWGSSGVTFKEIDLDSTPKYTDNNQVYLNNLIDRKFFDKHWLEKGNLFFRQREIFYSLEGRAI